MNDAMNDLGSDLTIKKIDRRTNATGVWVIGALHGHRFEALVFAEHALETEYEIGGNGPDGSRISKLWIRRESDRETVYNWDRGADVETNDELVGGIVGFLCAGLAETVFPKGGAA